MSKSKYSDQRWRIIHIIGYVEASDADTAIKKAIDEFKITNAQIQQCLFCRADKGKRTKAPTADEGPQRPQVGRRSDAARCGVLKLTRSQLLRR
jgi:hypothetical protein